MKNLVFRIVQLHQKFFDEDHKKSKDNTVVVEHYFCDRVNLCASRTYLCRVTTSSMTVDVLANVYSTSLDGVTIVVPKLQT